MTRWYAPEATIDAELAGRGRAAHALHCLAVRPPAAEPADARLPRCKAARPGPARLPPPRRPAPCGARAAMRVGARRADARARRRRSRRAIASTKTWPRKGKDPAGSWTGDSPAEWLPRPREKCGDSSRRRHDKDRRRCRTRARDTLTGKWGARTLLRQRGNVWEHVCTPPPAMWGVAAQGSSTETTSRSP